MIPIPGFMNHSNELILTLEQYNASLQPHIQVFLAKTAPQTLDFPPKWGLA